MYRPIETYRGFVYPWAMDHVGHMNVQFYTARFDEATWQFFARLGLSPNAMKKNSRALVAADQRTQYKQEVVDGSVLHITTELVEIGRKSIRFTHRMYDSETNIEVASTDLVGVFFDTDRRASVELPDGVRERAETLLASDDGSDVAPAAHAHRATKESDERGE
jgi:acyl-CoA thioester hydrolase